MIFTRIKRGAARAHALATIKLSSPLWKQSGDHMLSVKRLAVGICAANLMIASMPLYASSTVSAPDSIDSDDPSPVVVQAAAPMLTEDIVVYSQGETTALSEISIGKSYATEQAEKEAAARAEAQRIAAEKAAEEARVAASVRGSRIAYTGAGQSTPYDAYFQKYFGEDWKIARAIAWAESTMNPRAVSHTNDHGLMQIHNGLSRFGEAIYDPEQNIRIAAENFYARRGFSPWVTYKKGLHLRFL